MRRTISSLFALVLLASVANAEFVVFVSDRAPNESPTPGALNLQLTDPASMGNLYIYGDGDTRLSGLSLDLEALGNAIKLTSATVNNPSGRWSFLDGPLTIADNLISSIGGAAIPPGAPGIGGAAPDELPGGGNLIATIGYMGLGNAAGNTQLNLKVGQNLIADYEGNAAMVRLGGPQNPLIDGTVAGSAGTAGTIGIVGPTNTAPTGVDATIDNFMAGPGMIVNHQFTATDSETPAGPFTWGNLQFGGAPGNGGSGVANFQPTLGPTGLFTWNTNGSARGVYTAMATVTDPGGLTGTATLTINVTKVPEPATLALFGLALVGIAAYRRG